jgi:probable F420-dependent oxidoreductase
VNFALSLGLLNPSIWVEVTELADELGFESVWMPEHLVLPVTAAGSPFSGEDHPPVPPNLPVFDCFTYLGFLAGRTSRIQFGTHVYNIGLRHPFVSARAVATLDIISGGRFEFGIGSSWNGAEWTAVGLDFASRGRRVDEAITVCRRLWTEDVIAHHGEFFDFDDVMFEPKPVQKPHPPIVVGGDSPAALRRTAVLGDGWIPMNHTIDQIPASAARIAELRAKAGREGRVEITLGGNLEDVERYAAAGVDRMIVRPWTSAKNALESMHRFAKEAGLG